jgi:CTP-dependent riboflavin kinase
MSTFKQTVDQYNELHAQISEAAQDAFQKYQDAGLIRQERLEDGEYVMVPQKGYKYSKFEVDANWDFIEIEGSVYTGCGEYDYITINVPLSALDNNLSINAWIAQEKAKIEAANQKKAEEKAAKEAQAKLEQEQAEREYFNTLKEKYEGQGTNQAIAGN